MTKANVIELKVLFNRYTETLNVGLDKFIKKTKNDTDIVKFKNDPDIFDGFHETYLLTKRFHENSGYKLNFMEDYAKMSDSIIKLVELKDRLELEIVSLQSQLSENDIEYYDCLSPSNDQTKTD